MCGVTQRAGRPQKLPGRRLAALGREARSLPSPDIKVCGRQLMEVRTRSTAADALASPDKWSTVGFTALIADVIRLEAVTLGEFIHSI